MLRQTSETATPAAPPASYPREGVIYGVLSYGLWGLVPLYFKLVADVWPPQVLAWRIIWAWALLALFITLVRRWRDVAAALRTRPVMLTLSITMVLLAFNWFVYIYAVTTNRIVDASLGYFLNPLVNVLLGVVILGERLRRWQTAGVALAGVGVVIMGAPWIAVSLALSFAFYGLLRKQVAVDGLLALFIETLLLLPASLAFVGYLQATGANVFVFSDPAMCLTLMAGGAVTCGPLLLFGAAARRLRFATLGILQYLAPTTQFLLAVFLFGEQLSTVKLVALCFIWAAVVIYSIDSLRLIRDERRAARQAAGLQAAADA